MSALPAAHSAFSAAADAHSDAPHARRVPPHDPFPPHARRVHHADIAARLDRLRRLARLMDSSFEVPGLGLKLGLDPIVGLVPVLGDILTTAVSIYIVQQAQALGVRRSTLAKMIANVALDFLVGEIPALGDVFDLVFKANNRNLKLIEDDLARRGLL